MSVSYPDLFRKRARQYRIIALWSAIAALYLLGLSWANWVPAPTQNTAFSTISFPFKIVEYWKALGLTVHDFEGEKTAGVLNSLLTFIPGLLRLILIPLGILCVVLRKPKGLIIIALAFQLSMEVGSRLEVKTGMYYAPMSTFMPPALSQAAADASAPTRAVLAGHSEPSVNGRSMPTVSDSIDRPKAAIDMAKQPLEERLCMDLVMASQARITGFDCDAKWTQNMLRFVLLQHAYLKNDPHLAATYYNAIDPGHMRDASSMVRWRMGVMREWLTAKGFKPAAGSYDSDRGLPIVHRVIAISALGIGVVSGVVAGLVLWLALILSQRAERIAAYPASLTA